MGDHHHHRHQPAIPAQSRSAFAVSVKLADSTEFEDCNTDTMLSTMVKKPQDITSFKTVAQFGREVLSNTAPAWLLRIIRRHITVRKRSKAAFVISFGGGYDLIVLLEGADMPKDVSRVSRTTVSLSITTKTEEATRGSANLGLTDHNDSIWDHVDAVASAASGAHEVLIVLSDNRAPYGAFEGHQERLEVIRLWTHPKSLFEISRIDRSQEPITAGAAASLEKSGEDSGDDAVVKAVAKSTRSETAPTHETTNTKKAGAKTTSAGGKEKGKAAPATASPKRQTKVSQKKQATPKETPASSAQKESAVTKEPGRNTTTVKKKPGRPKGSKNKPKEQPIDDRMQGEPLKDVEAQPKSPSLPKRPLSAYMYFCAAKRPEVSERVKTLGEISKELARLWSETDDRSEYEDLAAKDKARYVQEKSALANRKGSKGKDSEAPDVGLATPPRKKPAGSKKSTDKTSAAVDSESTEEDETTPKKKAPVAKVTKTKAKKKAIQTKPVTDDRKATEEEVTPKKKAASKKSLQEAEAQEDENEGKPPPKKRGRPKGSKNKPKGESAKKKAKT